MEDQMNREMVKIFVVCAASAVIGGTVALELFEQFSLWAMLVGVLIGGSFGYVFWEWKTFVQAIPKAWAFVCVWKRAEDFWLVWFFATLASFSLVLFACTISLSVPLLHENKIVLSTSFVLWGISFIGIVSVLYGFNQARQSDTKRIASLEEFLIISWYFFPVSLLFFHVPRWIWRFVCLMSKFVSKLVRIVYSENRLICMVGSASGVVVGYLFWNLIICGIAGGVIGLLSREFIAKRWLKLVPR